MKLQTVEDELKAMDKKKASGVVEIRGKQYQTVAYRIQQFREKHPDWSLLTDVVERDAECVVVRAAIVDDEGRTLATGHAEEYRSSSQINRTSALENAETSALGRALAALGFGGTEFATANEVLNAIHQQENRKPISEDEFERIKELAPKAGKTLKDLEAAYKVKGLLNLTADQAEKCISRLEKLANA